MKTGREQVLYIILEVLDRGKNSNTIIHQMFRENSNHAKERSFIKKLSYGVIERAIELDVIIQKYSKIKIKKMKPVIRNILRMGVYELKYMETIPDSATCNEAVILAGKKGISGLKGFVNGILRNISRDKDAAFDLSSFSFSEQYSMPDWIVSLLLKQYNNETVEQILSSFLEEKPVTIRVNQRKIKVSDYFNLLCESGYKVEPGRFMKEAFRLKESGDVEMFPGFSEGYFAVQDESSMLPVTCAGIQEGQRILDVCAAPGGKTLQAAEYTGEKGFVFARDLTEYKCKKIRENIERLGFGHIDIKCQDARVQECELIGRMDVVIADVPCSGMGLLGKKPDIKYHITEQSVNELTILQKQIIDSAVSYVKPGGVFMYSTCTIHEKENEENIKYIIEHYPFVSESMSAYLPECLKPFEKDSGMLTILPHITESDGFFLAKLRRLGS